MSTLLVCNFNGSNNTPLTLVTMQAGPHFVAAQGNGIVTSNQGILSVVPGDLANILPAETGVADGTITLALSTPSSQSYQIGCILRYADLNNWDAAFIIQDSANPYLEMASKIGGTYASLGTVGLSGTIYSQTPTLTCILLGSTITLTESIFNTTKTVTNATANSANTKHGLYGYRNTGAWVPTPLTDLSVFGTPTTSVPTIGNGTITGANTVILPCDPHGSAIIDVRNTRISFTGNFTNSAAMAAITNQFYGGTSSDTITLTVYDPGYAFHGIVPGVGSLTLVLAAGTVYNAAGDSAATTVTLTNANAATVNVDSWVSTVYVSPTSYTVTTVPGATAWWPLLSLSYDPNLPLGSTVTIQVLAGATLVGTKNWVFRQRSGGNSALLLALGII